MPDSSKNGGSKEAGWGTASGKRDAGLRFLDPVFHEGTNVQDRVLLHVQFISDASAKVRSAAAWHLILRHCIPPETRPRGGRFTQADLIHHHPGGPSHGCMCLQRLSKAIYFMLLGAPIIIGVSIFSNYDNRSARHIRYTYHGIALSAGGLSSVAGIVTLSWLWRTLWLVRKSKRKQWCAAAPTTRAQSCALHAPARTLQAWMARSRHRSLRDGGACRVRWCCTRLVAVDS
jgi:hypothetical protein